MQADPASQDTGDCAGRSLLILFRKQVAIFCDFVGIRNGFFFCPDDVFYDFLVFGPPLLDIELFVSLLTFYKRFHSFVFLSAILFPDGIEFKTRIFSQNV